MATLHSDARIAPLTLDSIPKSKLVAAANFEAERLGNLSIASAWLETVDTQNKDTTQEVRLRTFKVFRELEVQYANAEARKADLQAKLKEAKNHLLTTVKKIETYDSTVSSKQQLLQARKGDFENLTRVRQGLVERLVISELKNLEVIDQRDPTNKPFEWLLETVYGEPFSKYYWTNFKRQAFDKDQGADLKVRLANLKVSAMTTTATEATDVVLAEKDRILAAIQKNNPKTGIPPSMNVLVEIAQNVRESRKVWVEYSDNEKSLHKTVEEHGVVVRERSKYETLIQILEERIFVTTRIYTTYKNLVASVLSREGDKINHDQFERVYKDAITKDQPMVNSQQSLQIKGSQVVGFAAAPIPSVVDRDSATQRANRDGQQPQQPQQPQDGVPEKKDDCRIF